LNIKYYKYLFVVSPLFLFSSCLSIIDNLKNNDDDGGISDGSGKEQMEFHAVKIKNGLIEMDSKNFGKYITPAMVLIRKGEFFMGDLQDIGEEDEKPVRKVKIDYEFFFGKYEVTFNEYDKFVSDTKKYRPSDNGWGRSKKPVIYVSWNDANAYAKWLSKKSGDTYRLPTEAEWEYVARAGTNTRFYFGDSIDYLNRYGWFWNNSQQMSHDVGTLLPNQWDIYDMHGNVWEWCLDSYVNNYKEAPNNGSAYTISSEEKVLRGGSWNDGGEFLRYSNRYGFNSSIKMNDTGFRLVRVLKTGFENE
jgi:formylglycine-generating enzyme required for sulfatase activity